MSEKYIPRPEQHEHTPNTHENAQEQHEKLARAAEHGKEARHEQAEKLPELQEQAKAEAISGKEFSVAEKEQSQPVSNLEINRSVKEASRRRVMKRVRRHLRPDERLLSKVTHQPVVDAVSRAAEKTIARPSGLFGGGLLAFVGSTAYLWIARHYGYSYNYFLFIALFVGGFFLGMTIELIVKSLRKK